MVSVQMKQSVSYEPATLGERVKQLRNATGYTGNELAELVGCSGSYIRHLETGRVKLPGPDMLKALASALGTEVWDLLIAAGYLEPGPVLEGVDPALIRAAKGRSKQSQKKITELLRDLP